jgi:hypothetical protein
LKTERLWDFHTDFVVNTRQLAPVRRSLARFRVYTLADMRGLTKDSGNVSEVRHGLCGANRRSDLSYRGNVVEADDRHNEPVHGRLQVQS